MTTKNSPLARLKAQADQIAQTLKAAERGEKIDVRFAARIAAARGQSRIEFAVVMDDKILTIDMPWTLIRATSAAGIAEYIVSQMREARHAVH
jgi:hypothetical protein